jgi:NAD-dependent SIR2 family protein deacetylase
LLLPCTKCGADTEQSYIGSCQSPPRIVTRCNVCKQTNFTDSWKIDNENRKIRQNAKVAKLEAARVAQLQHPV